MTQDSLVDREFVYPAYAFLLITTDQADLGRPDDEVSRSASSDM